MPTIGGVMPEGSSFIGPFIDGNGNIYTVTEVSPTDPNFEPAMRKSTDGGDNWSEVDSGGRPTHDDIESLWMVQAGTKLHLLHQRSGTYRISYHEFNTSDASSNADTWALVDEVVHTPSSAPVEQSVCLVRLSTGVLYAFYKTEPSGSDQRIAWRKRLGTNSWSSQNFIAESGKNFYQVAAVVGDSDVIHVFIKDDTSGSPRILYYSITSDTLSGQTVFASGSDVASLDLTMVTPVVRLDPGGTERLYCAWMNSSNILVGKAIDGGTPGSVQTISDNTVRSDPGTSTSRQPVACLGVWGDKIVALYADLTSFDLFRDDRNGTWGTDVEVHDAANYFYVWGNVFVSSGNTVFGYVWGDGDNIVGTESDSTPMYGEIILEVGGDPQLLLPDADTVTTGWTSTPLYSKVNDASDATIIQATLA